MVPAKIEAAAAILREAGWTVLPPPPVTIPEPKMGQVWFSPKPGTEPRTVVSVGPHSSWSGRQCVFFTTPKRPPSEWGPTYLHMDAWKTWVKKAGARPLSEKPV